MFSGEFFGQEQTGGLYDVFSLYFVPFQVGRVAFCRYADHVAVDDQIAVFYFDRAVEFAVYRVKFEHVSHVLGVDQVVDADNLDVGAGDSSPENQTTDTAETVDANSYFFHDFKCFLWLIIDF